MAEEETVADAAPAGAGAEARSLRLWIVNQYAQPDGAAGITRHATSQG